MALDPEPAIASSDSSDLWTPATPALDALIDALPVCIAYVDTNRRYRFNNRAYGDWFQRPHQSIAGHHVRDILGEDAYQRAAAHMDRCLAGETVRYDSTLLRPDGGLRHFRATYIPDFGPDGNVAGFFVLGEDVSDLKAAEEALQASLSHLERRVSVRTAAIREVNEELEAEIAERRRIERHLIERENRLRTMLDASIDAIVTIDPHGRIESANASAERLFASPATDIVGENAERLLPELAEQDAGDGQGLKLDQTIRRETLARRMDGSTFSAEVSVETVALSEGAVRIAFVRDVSERKRAERTTLERQAQLSRALRLNTMGEVAATLAHELNQPLSAVLSYIQACRRLMAARGELRPDLAVSMDKAAAQAQRAGDIIGNIRRFLNRGATDRELVDVSAVAREAAALAALEAARQGVTVSLDLAAARAIVLGDRVALGQVILNLIQNSIEASASVVDRQAEVTLSTASGRGDDGVIVAVRDTGPGVPSGIAARVFEPFVTSKTDGLGLGLAICQSIVRDHGGTLWFINIEGSGGGGAMFSFALKTTDPDGDHHVV